MNGPPPIWSAPLGCDVFSADAYDGRPAGSSATQHRERLGWRVPTDAERAAQLERNLDDVCPAERWAERDCKW
jgi:hypothetical protein